VVGFILNGLELTLDASLLLVGLLQLFGERGDLGLEILASVGESGVLGNLFVESLLGLLELFGELPCGSLEFGL